MENHRKLGAKRTLLLIAALILSIVCISALLVRCGFLHMQRDAVSTVEKPVETPLPSPTPIPSDASTVQPVAVAPSPSPTAVPIYRIEPIDPDVVNVLLIGTDSRKASGAKVSGNADTTILASFNRRTNTITLVSFLRSAAVTIGGLDGEYGKLKTAYTIGGVGTLVNTINDFFTLDIRQYCAVGLNGFVAFVDETLGGVDMELDRAEIDYINERITAYQNEIDAIKNCPLITAPPGTIHLSGAQLLAFVRNRTTALDGEGGGSDFDRADRQQEALETIYHKIVAEQPLSAIPGLVGFSMQQIETNLSAEEIYALAVPLLTDPPVLRSVSVPFAGTWEYGGDGDGILFPREATIEALHTLLYTD